MGRARGANALMNFAIETGYGTPPVSGYRRMPFVSSQLGAEQGLIADNLLGQGRAPSDPTYDVVNNDGDVVVPMETISLGYWLRLLLGAPSTTGAGPYTHVFTSGAASLPSASIEIGHPDRPTFSTNYGLRANTFQVQMQRSGLADATIGLIGKGETVAAATSSAGTVTVPASPTRFVQATGTVLIDGSAIGEVVSARVAFSNGLEKDETIRPDGEINDVDPGMPTGSLTLTTKFADATLLNKATSMAPVSIDLLWTAPSGASLQLSFPKLFLPRSKRPISGPGGIQVDFNAQASTDSNGLFFRATLVNTISAYA